MTVTVILAVLLDRRAVAALLLLDAALEITRLERMIAATVTGTTTEIRAATPETVLEALTLVTETETARTSAMTAIAVRTEPTVMTESPPIRRHPVSTTIWMQPSNRFSLDDRSRGILAEMPSKVRV